MPFISVKQPKKGPDHRQAYKLEYFEKHSEPVCEWCRCPITFKSAQVGHAQARSRNGSHCRNNLRIVCVSCVRKKKSLPENTFLRKMGYPSRSEKNMSWVYVEMFARDVIHKGTKPKIVQNEKCRWCSSIRETCYVMNTEEQYCMDCLKQFTNSLQIELVVGEDEYQSVANLLRNGEIDNHLFPKECVVCKEKNVGCYTFNTENTHNLCLTCLKRIVYGKGKSIISEVSFEDTLEETLEEKDHNRIVQIIKRDYNDVLHSYHLCKFCSKVGCVYVLGYETHICIECVDKFRDILHLNV